VGSSLLTTKRVAAEEMKKAECRMKKASRLRALVVHLGSAGAPYCTAATQLPGYRLADEIAMWVK
jgi:hypothetical protein